jgi:ADP-heptose:LPS heptosyltransferase
LPFVEKFAPRETASALAAFAASRKISLPPAKEIFKGEEQTGRYVVIHPGSGSRKKNWPLENFIQVGARLQRAKAPGGAPFFKRMVVVSGEADGDLGERLHRSLPGSRHLHGLELESLASLIAGAFLYVGNDSGVSHLAGSVVGPTGESPLLAVVFGPSDSRVWAPPGALVLEAGPDLDKLDPIGVCGQIGKSLGFSC